MTSCDVTLSIGLNGNVQGTADSAAVKAKIGSVFRSNATGTGNMIYNGAGDNAKDVGPLGALAIDLTTGLKSPLNEDIEGDLAFAAVTGFIVAHAAASAALEGILVFGGGGNDFQGPLPAGTKIKLLPGEAIGFNGPPTGPGWPVSASAREIVVESLDPGGDATVHVAAQGLVA